MTTLQRIHPNDEPDFDPDFVFDFDTDFDWDFDPEFEAEWAGIEEPFVVGDADEAFAAVQKRFDQFAEWIAERRARHDPVLRDELLQAARIALWELDVTRLRPEDAEYVRGLIVNVIRTAYWAEFEESGGTLRDEHEMTKVVREGEDDPVPFDCRIRRSAPIGKAKRLKKRGRKRRVEAEAKSEGEPTTEQRETEPCSVSIVEPR